MIIKKAQYKKVRKTVNVMMAPEQYGCDCCRKKIDRWEGERLEMTVFQNPGAESTHYHFCSWRCVFRFIPSINCNYFFNLPYVSYDRMQKGRTAKDFMNVIADIPWLGMKKVKK